MQERRLSIKGHELAVYEYNEDKNNIPLIFIHGITGNIGFWQGVQIPLMEQAHWFSLSLPGHFPAVMAKDFQPEDMSAEMLAEVMSEAISQLTGGKAAILVGHSTGGFAALCVAHHRPELVKNLVLVDGFALGKWYGAFWPAQAIAQLGEKAFWLYWKSFSFGLSAFRLAYMLLGTNWKALRNNPAFEQSVVEGYPAMLRLDVRAMWIYFKRMPQIDIRAWLPKIKSPVSIIHGKRDSIIPPKHAEEMQKLLPNQRFHWIDESGHIPMFENPSAYHAALTAALEGAMLETRARA
jgi:pimeloyl-ACP methyl ester carboxylesterase